MHHVKAAMGRNPWANQCHLPPMTRRMKKYEPEMYPAPINRGVMGGAMVQANSSAVRSGNRKSMTKATTRNGGIAAPTPRVNGAMRSSPRGPGGPAPSRGAGVPLLTEVLPLDHMGIDRFSGAGSEL